MAMLTRRRVLGLGLAGAGGLALGGRLLVPRLLRTGQPRALDGEARAFVERCFDGVDRTLMWDSHAHLVGIGQGGTGCEMNAELRSPLHPIKNLQLAIYMAASGVTDEARADEQYLDRLLASQRLANPRGKLLLLAFDRAVGPDGVEQPARTEMYTPDDRVLAVARAHPEVRACASVHPYRTDALERLQHAHDAGALAVKWLPNAMGIDPASPRCERFYRKLAELDMPLITHTGREQAVDARDAQALGNPLRLRRPLDAGVRVVAAHFASLGDDEDLDRGGGGGRIASFDLLMRLFAEPAYARTLFADISALPQVNRCGRPLRTLLASPEPAAGHRPAVQHAQAGARGLPDARRAAPGQPGVRGQPAAVRLRAQADAQGAGRRQDPPLRPVGVRVGAPAGSGTAARSRRLTGPAAQRSAMPWRRSSRRRWPFQVSAHIFQSPANDHSG